MINKNTFFKLSREDQLYILLDEVKETNQNPEYIIEKLYFDDETGIFYNLLNAQSEEDLSSREYFATSKRIPIAKIQEFSIEGLCKLHKDIFQDVYVWAGQTRLMDIYKTERFGDCMYESSYCPWVDISPLKGEGKLSLAIDNMVNDKYGKNYSEDVEKITGHLLEIWDIHPFMDGNTRTCLKFCLGFGKEKGIDFNLNRLSNEEKINMHKTLANVNSNIKDITEENTEILREIMHKCAGDEGYKLSRDNLDISF